MILVLFFLIFLSFEFLNAAGKELFLQGLLDLTKTFEFFLRYNSNTCWTTYKFGINIDALE